MQSYVIAGIVGATGGYMRRAMKTDKEATVPFSLIFLHFAAGALAFATVATSSLWIAYASAFFAGVAIEQSFGLVSVNPAPETK